MSNSSPSPTPTNTQRETSMTTSYQTFLHNTSLALLFLSPALIALPPRKLDLYTVALGGSFLASANHLAKERTGGRGGLLSSMPFAGRADKESQNQPRTRLLEEPSPLSAPSSRPAPSSTLEAKAKELWMGGEQEGWKERRLREEQEKINQGEGYGSMIMDQIWEVWNWGEKRGEEIEAKDEEVLYRRQQEQRAKRREEEFPATGQAGRRSIEGNE